MKNSSKPQPDWLKFVRLDWLRQWLLVRVFVVLAVYKCLLLMLPFNRFIRTAKPASPARKPISENHLTELMWAITVVSNRVPLGFTCLVQALSAKWLLKTQPDVRLCIGVQKNRASNFSAHAWIEYKGRTILGEQAGHAFEPILEWT